MSKYEFGIVLILVGIGVALVAFALSSGYHPQRGIGGNIQNMKIVVNEGVYIEKTGSIWADGHYEDRVAIPYKYFFGSGAIMILLGIGKMLLGKATTLLTLMIVILGAQWGVAEESELPANFIITTKDGIELTWSNYVIEYDQYCTMMSAGKFCLPKSDVTSIKKTGVRQQAMDIKRLSDEEKEAIEKEASEREVALRKKEEDRLRKEQADAIKKERRRKFDEFNENVRKIVKERTP